MPSIKQLNAHLHGAVKVVRDIPEEDLEEGEIGVLLAVLRGTPKTGVGVALEFFTADGKTKCVPVLSVKDIELV
jgi:hypothetical protein